jgi:hypothetical protein
MTWFPGAKYLFATVHTHTQDCVRLVCGQRAVCQRYDSLSDRSQQQQHAHSHVDYCHLQIKMHLPVQRSPIHLISKLNNVLINEICYSLLERDQL